MAKFPDKVKAYRKGKKGLAGFFMGQIMRMSKTKLDPKLTNKTLIHKLNKK
jgi:aspartyl-tRNA(Asn)/glutamyl-tRNA(Gln) amidotransferase subunit B